MPALPNEDVATMALAEVPGGEHSHGHVNDSKSPATGTTPHFEEESSISEDDLRNLRRVSGKIPWTAFTIAFVELCERFSYYGTTVVLVNFLQQPLPEGSSTGAGFDGQSGALGMGQRASTGLSTFNQVWWQSLFNAFLRL
jgi:POT family proton-dependent oligopeptide transporter